MQSVEYDYDFNVCPQELTEAAPAPLTGAVGDRPAHEGSPFWMSSSTTLSDWPSEINFDIDTCTTSPREYFSLCAANTSSMGLPSCEGFDSTESNISNFGSLLASRLAPHHIDSSLGWQFIDSAFDRDLSRRTPKRKAEPENKVTMDALLPAEICYLPILNDNETAGNGNLELTSVFPSSQLRSRQHKIKSCTKNSIQAGPSEVILFSQDDIMIPDPPIAPAIQSVRQMYQPTKRKRELDGGIHKLPTPSKRKRRTGPEHTMNKDPSSSSSSTLPHYQSKKSKGGLKRKRYDIPHPRLKITQDEIDSYKQMEFTHYLCPPCIQMSKPTDNLCEFGRKSDLIRHIEACHGPRIPQCGRCGDTYSRDDALDRHRCPSL